MDLKDMLNDGPAEEAKKKSPEAQRDRQPQPPTPSGYGAQSQQQTPLYAPLSASPTRQSQSLGLTPLQTPSQGPGSGQYPFPQHPAQSPAAVSASQQYRPYGSSSASTPLARPSSLGYQYPPPPLSHHPPSGVPQSLQSRSTSSLSPTPPSHHSPHSVRQSPLSARSQAPNQAPPQHGYQHSHPSTPLGPPSLSQRYSNIPDIQSPFHQRTYSGASNGIVSGSPAHHQYGGRNAVESPSAYHRPSLHHQQTSEYLGRIDRERSESVSPKTKVLPKPPSLGSRQSTQHELHRRESSLQANAGPLTGSPHHVIHPLYSVAQPSFGQRPNAASEVSQATPTSNYGAPNSLGQSSVSESSLSQANNQRPPLIHHSSSKMGMDHLLTLTSELPPSLNGPSASMDGAGREMGPPAPPMDPAQHQSLDRATTLGSQTGNDSKPFLKRPAESEISDGRPSKQRKTRRYAQRPIWARLSKHNPRFHQQDAPNGTATSHQRPRNTNQPNGGQVHQADGHPNMNAPVPDGRPPWLNNPPLDHDLIHARQLLGGKWEKTFKWNTPYPDMLMAVQNWLGDELNQLGDVGRDPRDGTIEIEAKFGTLKHEGNPFNLPVENATVIRPQENHRLHFESTMTEAEHEHMNKFLNKHIQASMQPGRVNMSYKHLRETDSFHNLSKLGQQVLPQSLQRRQGSRKPRLRITRNDKAQGRPVIARIVKIPISNLHIFNPAPNYDCRISINLEVNLDRPDLDLDSLISDDKGQQAPEIDREKDRIAYRHLEVYSIDLTKVTRKGLEATHELELEVDSNVLREQMALMKDGKPNAFGDVVSGFLDNATFLMRERPNLKPEP